MEKFLSITQLSYDAWKIYCQHWASWVILATGGIILSMLVIAIQFYMPDYYYIALFGLCLVGAVYTALLHQNGLDAASDRSLTMFHITPSILFASLLFILVFSYKPFQEFLELLYFIDFQSFNGLLAVHIIMSILISYFSFRCMFAGMIILEEQQGIYEAFGKSFQLTAHNLLFLLGLFLYLEVTLYIGAVTVIGYFIALPYVMIMKSLAFKRLQEISK